mmetsp:Transcript_38936/g.124968  ORF Transcript_38936/g.124968 Transcript_38936/m.124968 type:complete len:230 (+) Transcript_38936:1114-1803(+)
MGSMPTHHALTKCLYFLCMQSLKLHAALSLGFASSHSAGEGQLSKHCNSVMVTFPSHSQSMRSKTLPASPVKPASEQASIHWSLFNDADLLVFAPFIVLSDLMDVFALPYLSFIHRLNNPNTRASMEASSSSDAEPDSSASKACQSVLISPLQASSRHAVKNFLLVTTMVPSGSSNFRQARKRLPYFRRSRAVKAWMSLCDWTFSLISWIALPGPEVFATLCDAVFLIC